MCLRAARDSNTTSPQGMSAVVTTDWWQARHAILTDARKRREGGGELEWRDERGRGAESCARRKLATDTLSLPSNISPVAPHECEQDDAFLVRPSAIRGRQQRRHGHLAASQQAEQLVQNRSPLAHPLSAEVLARLRTPSFFLLPRVAHLLLPRQLHHASRLA